MNTLKYHARSLKHMKFQKYLSYVHSTRGLEPIVADRLGLVGQQIPKLILLDALLSHTPHDLVLLLQTQSAPKYIYAHMQDSII